MKSRFSLPMQLPAQKPRIALLTIITRVTVQTLLREKQKLNSFLVELFSFHAASARLNATMASKLIASVYDAGGSSCPPHTGHRH